MGLQDILMNNSIDKIQLLLCYYLLIVYKEIKSDREPGKYQEKHLKTYQGPWSLYLPYFIL